MKNELLTIGPFTVYGYGLMIAIGILAGCLTAEYRAGKQKLDSEQIFPMILWCLVGGFFCAKLLFWITEWKSIVQDPGFIMETLSSGFVVFGGIIGGILTGLLYCRIRKLVFFKYADVILPSVARNKKEDGQVTACYLIFYSIGRFVIEFFRGDIIRGSVGILSTSQFISIFTGIAGIVLLIRIRKKRDSKSSV